MIGINYMNSKYTTVEYKKPFERTITLLPNWNENCNPICPYCKTKLNKNTLHSNKAKTLFVECPSCGFIKFIKRMTR